MTEKTFSQKVARAFEIADYFLLIPAAFGLFWAGILIFSAPWFTLPIFAVAGYGVFLMTRYFKHSRGNLDADKIASMWIGTIIYNALLSLPIWYFAFVAVKEYTIFEAKFSGNLFGAGTIIAALIGYLTIIGFSLKACFSEGIQKYR